MLEEDIFLQAIAKSTPAERAQFLQAACGGDLELRARVDELLAVHDHPDSFLQNAPVLALAATVDHEPARDAIDVGQTIGRYKLLQRLGEGGMGTVFMAQQTAPVKRTVAVKVIQQGMNSRDFLARFEAERQALALMDHPNIARVLDAGCTESGRPYFVMELVKGIPITRFCDENRLQPPERLRLFVQVCQAVQHAHHKGIIHRDLNLRTSWLRSTTIAPFQR